MKRSVDQALLDLRAKIATWAAEPAGSGVYVFVYPPEWEAAMLSRFQQFAGDCESEGWHIDLVDVGQGFLEFIEAYGDLEDQLATVEREAGSRVLSDLNVLASDYLSEVLTTPLQPPAIARVLINTGALATLVSYSAICSGLRCDDAPPGAACRNVIAFPGEGDERSLNLLGLRSDTNYRIPRI
jgi:hypothetical protein